MKAPESVPCECCGRMTRVIAVSWTSESAPTISGFVDCENCGQQTVIIPIFANATTTQIKRLMCAGVTLDSQYDRGMQQLTLLAQQLNSARQWFERCAQQLTADGLRLNAVCHDLSVLDCKVAKWDRGETVRHREAS